MEDPHPTRKYPDQKVWVWVPFSCPIIGEKHECFWQRSLTAKQLLHGGKRRKTANTLSAFGVGPHSVYPRAIIDVWTLVPGHLICNSCTKLFLQQCNRLWSTYLRCLMLNGMFRRSSSLAIPHRISFAAITSVSLVLLGNTDRNVSVSKVSQREIALAEALSRPIPDYQQGEVGKINFCFAGFHLLPFCGPFRIAKIKKTTNCQMRKCTAEKFLQLFRALSN